MIRSFKGKFAESIFDGKKPKGFPADLVKRAAYKLEVIEAATNIEDLRIPPGNRLEELEGDRRGQHSIRINDQFRVCFRWEGSDAWDVEVADYH